MNLHDEFSNIINNFTDFTFRNYYYYGISFKEFYDKAIHRLEMDEPTFDNLVSYCEINNIDIKSRIENIWKGFNVENLIREGLNENYKTTSTRWLDNIGIDILLEQENIAIQVKSKSLLNFSLESQQNYIVNIIISIILEGISKDNKAPTLIIMLYDDNELYYCTINDFINYDIRTNSIKLHHIVELDNIFLEDYLQDVIENIREP